MIPNNTSFVRKTLVVVVSQIRWLPIREQTCSGSRQHCLCWTTATCVSFNTFTFFIMFLSEIQCTFNFTFIVHSFPKLLICQQTTLPVLNNCYLCLLAASELTLSLSFTLIVCIFLSFWSVKQISFPRLLICWAAILPVVCLLASDHLPGTRSHQYTSDMTLSQATSASQFGLVFLWGKASGCKDPDVNALVSFEWYKYISSWYGYI